MSNDSEIIKAAGFTPKTADTGTGGPGADANTGVKPAEKVVEKAAVLPAAAGQNQNSSGEAATAGTNTQLPNEEETKFLNGRFGGRFKSMSEIEEQLGNLTKLENEHKQLVEKSAKSPFHNEYIKGLNEFLAKGGSRETFDTVQRIDTTEKADPKEILSLRLQIEKKLSKEDADFLVMRQYRLEEGADPEKDPDVREARLRMMKIDLPDAIESLEEYKVEAMSLPEKPDQEKVVAQKMEAWKPQIPKIVEQFKTIEIPIGDKVYLYEPDAEMQEHLTKHLQEVLANPHYESSVDEKGIAEAMAIVGRELLAKEFPKIVAKLVADAQGAVNYSFLKEKYNPGMGKQAPAPSVVPVDKDVALARQMDPRFK